MGQPQIPFAANIMDMSNIAATAASPIVSNMAATTSTTAAAMGMDMGPGACKISMLWNWYTIDSCFIARGWHIRSEGAFAATCVGVVLLVMSLEALRRLAKEYDARIIRQRIAALDAAENPSSTATATGAAAASSSDDDDDVNKPTATSNTLLAAATGAHTATRRFTPTLPQQLIRATFHLLQFAVAYLVMLLAMYYNGYIIICILIGAFLGSFIFGWESIALPFPGQEREREITYCCG